MSDSLDRAVALLTRVEQESADVVALARTACIAVRVEPRLIRSLRTRLLPHADVGIEADLWFSPLIEARGAAGFILDRHVVTLLRESLAKDQALLRRVIAVTAESNEHAPPAIRLEERVNGLALLEDAGAAAAIDEALRPAVLAMLQDEERGVEIARWAARAIPRFHGRVLESEAALLLAVGAAARLGVRPIMGETDQARTSTGRIAWVLPDARLENRVELGVELSGDGLRFAEPIAGRAVIRLPRTEPLILEVSWQENGTARQKTVDVAAGRTIPMPRGARDVTIRTLSGDEYHFAEVRDASDDSDLHAAIVRVDLPATRKTRRTEVPLGIGPLESPVEPISGFIVAPDRIITASVPFRGARIVDVHVQPDDPAPAATQQGPVSDDSPVRRMIRAEVLNPDAADDEPLVLAPLEGPVFPIRVGLRTMLSRRQDTVDARTRQTSAHALVLPGDGRIIGIHADEIVERTVSLRDVSDGVSRFEVPLASLPERPMVEQAWPAQESQDDDVDLPSGLLGAPVVYDSQAVGVVTFVPAVQDGFALRNPFLPARIRVAGAVTIEALLAQNAGRELHSVRRPAVPPQGHCLARVVILGRVHQLKEPLMRGLAGAENAIAPGARRTLWSVREPHYARDLVADIVLADATYEHDWPLTLDLRHAAAVLVVDEMADSRLSLTDSLRRARNAVDADVPILIAVLGKQADAANVPNPFDDALLEQLSAEWDAHSARIVDIDDEASIDAMRQDVVTAIDWRNELPVPAAEFEAAHGTLQRWLRATFPPVMSVREWAAASEVTDGSTREMYGRITGVRTIDEHDVVFTDPWLRASVILALFAVAERTDRGDMISRRPGGVPFVPIDFVARIADRSSIDTTLLGTQGRGIPPDALDALIDASQKIDSETLSRVGEAATTELKEIGWAIETDTDLGRMLLFPPLFRPGVLLSDNVRKLRTAIRLLSIRWSADIGNTYCVLLVCLETSRWVDLTDIGPDTTRFLAFPPEGRRGSSESAFWLVCQGVDDEPRIELRAEEPVEESTVEQVTRAVRGWLEELAPGGRLIEIADAEPPDSEPVTGGAMSETEGAVEAELAGEGAPTESPQREKRKPWWQRIIGLDS